MVQTDKLHLGAYDVVHDGWHNTDVTLQIFIARIPFLPTLLYKLGRISPENYRHHQSGTFRKIHYLNVTKRFPFPDNTFNYIFSAHMFEHLFPDEAPHCLDEIYRVLKPGGIFRIAIPDLDYIIDQYDPQNTYPTLYSMFQGTSKKTHIRARHWWHYNERSLRTLLEQRGFKEIERCVYQQGRCADVAKIDNRPESLFMEASK